jgi:hypothetical protein
MDRLSTTGDGDVVHGDADGITSVRRSMRY